MAGGTFIDTDSEPGSWADALRFAPWFDLEHDGTLFANIAFLTPDRAFECPFHAVQQCPEAGCDHAAGTVCTYALCPGKRAAVSSFHADPIAKTNRDNPHGR